MHRNIECSRYTVKLQREQTNVEFLKSLDGTGADKIIVFMASEDKQNFVFKRFYHNCTASDEVFLLEVARSDWIGGKRQEDFILEKPHLLR